jgi:hypothetical protein
MIKIAVIIFLIFSISSFAQYRDDGLNRPSVKEGIVDSGPKFRIFDRILKF